MSSKYATAPGPLEKACPTTGCGGSMRRRQVKGLIGGPRRQILKWACPACGWESLPFNARAVAQAERIRQRMQRNAARAMAGRQQRLMR